MAHLRAPVRDRLVDEFGLSDPSKWNSAMREYSRVNDHVVVGEDGDVGELCYTKAGTRTVANVQDFDDHRVFDKEMEMVEAVTEFYHNELDDGYIRIDVTTGELGEGQVALTTLESGETLYAEEVGQETYDEAVLSLYEAED